VDDVIAAIAKLQAKIDMICREVADLKKFQLNAVQVLTEISSRLNALESQLDDVAKTIRKLNDRTTDIEKWKIEVEERWKADIEERKEEEKFIERVKTEMKYNTKSVIIGTIIGAVVGSLVNKLF